MQLPPALGHSLVVVVVGIAVGLVAGDSCRLVVVGHSDCGTWQLCVE